MVEKKAAMGWKSRGGKRLKIRSRDRLKTIGDLRVKSIEKEGNEPDRLVKKQKNAPEVAAHPTILCG